LARKLYLLSGFIYWEIVSPRGEGISADAILGGKYKKSREKRGEMEKKTKVRGKKN
jgi:hypothetical protein